MASGKKAQLKYKSNHQFKNEESIVSNADILKQKLAEDYWSIDDTNQQQNVNPTVVGNNQISNFTFDEEEFKSDPEKYLQSLPPEYLEMFKEYTIQKQESEIDQIIKDMNEAEEDTFDNKYAGCKCCKGYIYKCKDKLCNRLGKCRCAMAQDMENEAVEHFITECKDCTCCRGYVYTCIGKDCEDLKSCVCFSS